ncbi:hypothetical protein TUM3794_19760 [Shewanella colwelliana]|uniref:Uncharacterized protein n=1 Tax=Shewanella colwelliana TaxID=23 RepID=A0ABQ4P093_SHECO|nr:hypothetical protein [Shewanella colwelliana]GIU40860.1 hypothetical protein TUM3794_19760 [Shewanella colwelliana]
MKSTALIEQDKKWAEEAAAHRKEYLNSKRFFELSVEELIEMGKSDPTIPMVFFIVVFSSLLLFFHGLIRRRVTGF